MFILLYYDLDLTQKSMASSAAPPKRRRKEQVYRFAVSAITECMRPSREHRDDVIISLGRKDGLYNLLDIVFQTRCEGDDAIYSHMFRATLAGETYGGPFKGCGGIPCTREDPVPVGGLGLRKGDSGTYSMESVSFVFELLDIVSPKEGQTYPLVEDVDASESADTATSAEEADHLTSAEIAAALTFRLKFEVAAAGKNTWHLQRSTYKFEAMAYKPPPWGSHGGNSHHSLFQCHEIMGLLLNAGWKFSKVWKHILQHTLLNRTKSATAVRFSGMKKRTYEWDSCGGTLHTVAANSKRVVLAKRMSKRMMESILAKGVPTLGPKPLTQYEQMMQGGP